MTSPVAICNKALALIGANLILSLEDDQTEAIVCKAAYGMVRDKVLEDRVWTFASGRVQLKTPLAEPPPFGYGHKFLIPSNWIRVVKVDDLAGTGRLKWAREGEYILADAAAINVTYTVRVEDVSKWSAAALDALSYAMAAEMAIPLTENAAMMERMYAIYENKIVNAGATDGAQGRAELLRSNILTGRR